MESRQFRCRGCQKLHRQRAAEQKYCGAAGCQRKRKGRWQRERYATDVEYRLTATASTAAWLETQGGAASYHRAYRHKRKQQEHTGEGRGKGQLVRADRAAQSATGAARANRDAKIKQAPVMTGQYMLFAADGANKDGILVELRAIVGQSGESQIRTDFSGGSSGVRVEP